MKGRAIPYSPDEIAWVEVHAQKNRRDMHAEFCARFDRNDVSLTNLNSLCKRKGWFTGRNGRYAKGHTPENKGKTMPYNANSAATRFRPGQLPHNHKGAGHERIDSKDGYVVMIVAETNPWTGAATRPVHKHRWLWEKENGPIPEGYALKCLDGNKTNTDPNNWEAVPRGVLSRLNGGRHKKRLAYDAAPPELRPTVMAIAKLQHAAYEVKK